MRATITACRAALLVSTVAFFASVGLAAPEATLPAPGSSNLVAQADQKKDDTKKDAKKKKGDGFTDDLKDAMKGAAKDLKGAAKDTKAAGKESEKDVKHSTKDAQKDMKKAGKDVKDSTK
jgi:flagellar hook-basal body complex protein FliE